MPAVCTARRGTFLSSHPHTFCSWRGWISAVWRGDGFGGSLTYWPRQDARRSPDGWTDDEACLQCGSGQAQRTLERTLGGRPARDPAPGIFLRKSAGGRLGHANLVQRLKAGKPLCPTQRRYSTLWVCPTRCAHQRCHSLTRHWYWASGGNTWAHRERPPAPHRQCREQRPVQYFECPWVWRT